jgi:hypothetical protein
MEVRIAKAVVGKIVECRSLDKPSECARGAKAYVIEQNPDYVRGPCRGLGGLRPPLFGFSKSSANHALIGLCLLSMDSEFRAQSKDQGRCQQLQYAFFFHEFLSSNRLKIARTTAVKSR